MRPMQREGWGGLGGVISINDHAKENALNSSNK